MAIGRICGHHLLDFWGFRELDSGRKHLQDGAPAAFDALAARVDLHALTDLGDTSRSQHTGTFHLNDAHAAQAIGSGVIVVADGGDILG